jgi:sugar O-acyltransferase (sialic acid O-acetyltransferase NeuD family)
LKLPATHYLLFQLKTNDKIVVIGAVGSALNILYQIKDAIERFYYSAEIAGIIIDDQNAGDKVGDFKVLGSTKAIQRILSDTDYGFIFCLYRMDKMKERFDLFKSFGIPDDRLINFIHPLAYVSPDITLGTGNVFLSNTTILSGVRIGNCNIINSNITVEHNSEIGNGNFLSANVCIGSKVKIGDHCFVGLNTSVRENVKLGDDVFVGMHSLVLNDFSDVSIAGVPAKIIKSKG